MDHLTITRADLKKFAPKAKKGYVDTLLANLFDLRQAGILDSPLTLCHAMAQVGHETGGLTIIRESLTYTSTKRLREVWPGRFKDKTDAELKPLLRNPVALGDVVYGGRLGNTHPGDGNNFRGGGWLQTTGRGPVAKYCKRLGIEPVPAVLDDLSVTLKFFCMEWVESKCSTYACENDLRKVSKAINTGSASGNIEPVGMDERKVWFARAWDVWGDKGEADRPNPNGMSFGEGVAKIGGTTLALGLTGSQAAQTVSPLIPEVPPWITQAVANAGAWKSVIGTASKLPGDFMVMGLGSLGGIALVFAFHKWRNR